MYWRWVKAHVCIWKPHPCGPFIAIITGFHVSADGTFCTACHLVPEILDDCPVKMICGFFHKCWRYMDTYRMGLNAKQAEYAVKKYKSHHHCGPTMMVCRHMGDMGLGTAEFAYQIW
ncbi:hypothetical protein BJV74DRAFT_799759 [Russula compacta]|nr:hypothetical protein BJV74DRAFT_799759 [Russula compacta]